MAEISQTVSCRLPASIAAAVEDRRRALGKESVSEYLKSLIVADLNAPEPRPGSQPAPTVDIEPILNELLDLRDDFATLAVAMLVLGKEPRENAEEWARQHLSARRRSTQRADGEPR